MQVYHDGGFCFVCGKQAKLSELGGVDAPPEREPEDLTPMIEYIEGLTPIGVRGLVLPADKYAYYLLWPEKNYYKARYFKEGEGGRYRNPVGHRQPLFVANEVGSKTCLLVEGEFNALSFALAVPELDVVSPGASGNFSKNQLKQHLHSMLKYDILCIVVDEDAPGARAALEALPLLRRLGVQVTTWLMPVDANEILTSDGGRENLRQKTLLHLESKMGAGS